LKLPFYVAPSRRTYNLFLALRLVLAALGAYALARHRGLAPTPAWAAGAIFEVSGPMIAQLPFGSASPVCVLPWVILGSYSIAERRTAAALAGTGIALGVAGSGGHPTLVIMVFAAFAAATAGHVVARWRSPRAALAIGAQAALAGVLGLALAAPSLFPLAELAAVGSSYKHRPVGLAIWMAELRDARRTMPLGLFAPGALAALPRTVLAFAPAMGALGLIAAIAGILRGRIDAALAAVGLLGVALATAPPGLAWLHRVPGLELIVPRYAWPLVLLPLAQAAGAELGTLATSGGRGAWLVALVVFGAGAIAVRVAYAPPLARILLPLVVAAVAVGVCLALRPTRLSSWCAAVLAAVAVLEQLTTMLPFTRQRPSAALASPPSPAVRFLRTRLGAEDARMTGLSQAIGRPLTPMLFGLTDVRGLSALAVRRYYEYLRAISPRGVWFTGQDTPVVRSPLLDLAGVRYVVSGRGGPWRDPGMPVAYADDHVLVYENRTALPRVRIVHEATRVPNQEAAERWLTSSTTATGEASQLETMPVILEPDEDGNVAPELPATVHPAESVRVIDRTEPDHLALEARLEAPGMVVVADTYYPGWRAWVDGAPASIFPANLLFRAVFVPPGEHRIVFRYEPRSFRYGQVVCMLAVLAATVLLVRRSTTAQRVRRDGRETAGSASIPFQAQ
jgi:hypothetical protein